MIIEFSAEIEEYLELMRTAMNPPQPDVESVVKQIVTNTFLANIKTNAAVRPKAIAAAIKALEEQAEVIFQNAAN